MSKRQKLGESRFQNFDNLPREMLIEFLIRLSVLDLVSASLTCKAWYSIISKSEFVDLHLKHSAKRLGYLYSFDLKIWYFLDNKTIIRNKKADGERNRNWWGLGNEIRPRAINSSGGLVAYTIEKDSFCYVCNPFTGEEIKVEMGPFWGENFYTDRCGLGYSVASKQYKILLLAHPRTHGYYVPEDVCKGAIYTLGARSEWRELPGNVPYCVLSSCRPLDFEGSLFFFVFRDCDKDSHTVSIGSFDVESERFRLWSIPDDANMKPHHYTYKRLLSIGGCVAYAEINQDTGVSIWMLKDKLSEVWVKEINIKITMEFDPNLINRINIFGECAATESNNSEFPCILLSFSDGLSIYDTKDNSREVLMLGNGVGGKTYPIAHIESFVSPMRIMNVAVPRQV